MSNILEWISGNTVLFAIGLIFAVVIVVLLKWKRRRMQTQSAESPLATDHNAEPKEPSAGWAKPEEHPNEAVPGDNPIAWAENKDIQSDEPQGAEPSESAAKRMESEDYSIEDDEDLEPKAWSQAKATQPDAEKQDESREFSARWDEVEETTMVVVSKGKPNTWQDADEVGGETEQQDEPIESPKKRGEIRFSTAVVRPSTEPKEHLTQAKPTNEISEKVEFAVFSPKSITSNATFLIDVWSYYPHQYPDVVQIAQTIGREKALGRKTGVPVQKGAILTFRVEIRGLEIPEAVDSVIWDGSPTNTSFIVNVPEGTKIGSYPGKIIIGFEGITIANIVFLIEIASLPNFEYTDRSNKVLYPRSAFASYARENIDQVLSRIQGMQKIAPDLDIFIDVFSLRSGQNWMEKLEEHVPNKDIFYLFWSKPASISEWVEKEWRLAFQRRGISYIDPVPLEEPVHAPPPRELAALHFNDAYVAYIAYEELKRQAAKSSRC